MEERDRIGEVYGNFEVVGFIGAGGMGSVYRARQRTFRNRIVALKVLPREFALDERRRDRFENESDILASCNHPNLVTVYDRGEREGEYFFAMEFVNGGGLDKVLKTTGLPDVWESVAITRAVAEGLARAHGLGVIHRDIKPANILLSRSGEVKVTDFGIAKVGTAPSSTMPGSVLGTLAYMSPEQLADSSAVDHRTDIYSLGAVLHQMLTGLSPSPGKPFRRVGEINPAAPKELDALIERMVAPSPDDRYPDIAGVIADLKALGPVEVFLGRFWGDPARDAATIAHEHKQVTRASTPPPTAGSDVAATIPLETKTPSKRRAPWLAAGIAIVVLAAGLAGFLLLRNGPSKAPHQPGPVAGHGPPGDGTQRVPAPPVKPEPTPKPEPDLKAQAEPVPAPMPQPAPGPPSPHERGLHAGQDALADGDFAAAARAFRTVRQSDAEGEWGRKADAALERLRGAVSEHALAARKTARAFLRAAPGKREAYLAPSITGAPRQAILGTPDDAWVVEALQADVSTSISATVICLRKKPSGSDRPPLLAAHVLGLVRQRGAWLVNSAAESDLAEKLQQAMDAGRDAAKRKDNAGAIEAYRRAIDVCPAFVPAHIALHDTLLKDGSERLPQLVRDYSNRAHNDPSNAAFQFLVGRLMRDRTEMRARYRKALELEPGSFWPHYGNALLLLEEKKTQEAAAALEKAALVDPCHYGAQIRLARLYGESGQPDRQIRALEAAERAAPGELEPHQQLAIIHHKNRKWKEAAHEWEAFLRISPDVSQAHFLLAQIYDGPMPDPVKALHHYRAYLKLNPGDTQTTAQVKARVEQIEKTGK